MFNRIEIPECEICGERYTLLERCWVMLHNQLVRLLVCAACIKEYAKKEG